ncbi:MAG: T9SS type A sorting domain-containing protein [Flavobacteriales bacterium]
MGNFGYEYYIINWDDARRDIRLNAYSLLLLIEQMKQVAQNHNDDQQFVIVGASMGGIIARYTLNYMESSHYQNDDYEPFFVEAHDPYTAPFLNLHPTFPTDWERYVNNKDRMHNCRLYISVDAPHQGASIPIAYQYLFRQGQSVYKFLQARRMSKAKTGYLLKMLDGKSPRQLLKYWVPPKNSGGFNNNEYFPNPSHTSLFAQMRSFDGGEMPQFCKTIGLSDGAMDGSHNQNAHTGEARPPNDMMVDIDAQLQVQILWVKMPLVDIKMRLNTNPELVFGKVVDINISRTEYALEVFWFGVRFKTFHSHVINVVKNVQNMHSYSTAAGGTNNVISKSIKNSQNTALDRFLWRKLLGAIGFHASGELSSNGLDVCFVPLESALDYTGGSLPYGNNMLNTGNSNLGYLLSHTPFDVIAGEVHTKLNNTSNLKNLKNFEHGDIRNENDLVFNLTETAAPGWENAPALPNGEPDENAKYAFYTCANQNKYGAKRTWLSMEIGDEELYLENAYLPYSATYSAEYDIKVNISNPNYKYTTTPTTNDMKKGIFSKDQNYDVINSGSAFFQFDAGNSPSLPIVNRGVSGETSLNGTYNLHEEPFEICCQASLATRNATEWNKTPTPTYELLVFPNPTYQSHSVHIKSTLPSQAQEVTVKLISVLGREIYQATIPKEAGEENFQHTVNLFDIELTTGVYVLTLQAVDKLLTKKLIIR